MNDKLLKNDETLKIKLNKTQEGRILEFFLKTSIPRMLNKEKDMEAPR